MSSHHQRMRVSGKVLDPETMPPNQRLLLGMCWEGREAGETRWPPSWLGRLRPYMLLAQCLPGLGSTEGNRPGWCALLTHQLWPMACT